MSTEKLVCFDGRRFLTVARGVIQRFIAPREGSGHLIDLADERVSENGMYNVSGIWISRIDVDDACFSRRRAASIVHWQYTYERLD